jgi:hypothetical protein
MCQVEVICVMVSYARVELEQGGRIMPTAGDVYMLVWA